MGSWKSRRNTNLQWKRTEPFTACTQRALALVGISIPSMLKDMLLWIPYVTSSWQIKEIQEMQQVERKLCGRKLRNLLASLVALIALIGRPGRQYLGELDR